MASREWGKTRGGGISNPKSQALNPKQFQISKHKFQNDKSPRPRQDRARQDYPQISQMENISAGPSSLRSLGMTEKRKSPLFDRLRTLRHKERAVATKI
ncbi:MAG: hypothetical protein A3F68_13085 [Acidobacteria bacterium RIFCSPLOWO2_12_FULL_54_10]|nr:MAG: hypothetical protein A3F68_13085 [Acidobacteria bacterium RIFCSPLOWO2_12_FULL_54_10]